ncbi:MAG: tRNA (5-methylaminomethyl-2-thiouridine)(34)-methyltransferase MnmD [Fermentimonas sp.]
MAVLNNNNIRKVLQTTEDGSHTFYLPEIDEHYHSTHGAIQESKYIYIKCGLLDRINNIDTNMTINVLEIGFGTGLNTLLTALEANDKGLNIYYHTFELYPLQSEDIKKLNYPSLLSLSEEEIELFYRMHNSEWNKNAPLTSSFTLYKQIADISRPSLLRSSNIKYDVVYFDAFAPEKQPEMWTQEIFKLIHSWCNSGAYLTTYCAKGSVRRMLQSVGYSIERLPGPPGKREILRATAL